MRALLKEKNNSRVPNTCLSRAFGEGPQKLEEQFFPLSSLFSTSRQGANPTATNQFEFSPLKSHFHKSVPFVSFVPTGTISASWANRIPRIQGFSRKPLGFDRRHNGIS